MTAGGNQVVRSAILVGYAVPPRAARRRPGRGPSTIPLYTVTQPFRGQPHPAQLAWRQSRETARVVHACQPIPEKELTLGFSDHMMDKRAATLAAVLLMGHASTAWARTGGDPPVLKPAAPDSMQGNPDSPAGEFEKTKARRSVRVARKLGVGVLSGSALAIVGRHRVGFAHRIGPGAGAVVGVLLVDPPSWSGDLRSPLLALAGSSVGVLAGLGVPDRYLPNGQWPLILPAIGATVASEIWRESAQVSRLPIAAKPDARRTPRDTGRAEVRVAKKLGAGTSLGTLSGFVSANMLLSTVDLGPDGFGAPLVVVVGWFPASILGTAYGVSHLDPHDRFSMALFGSLLGSVAGIWASDFSGSSWSGGLPLLVCPAIGATIASELSRTPPKPGRLSIDLMPGPGGHLSMVVTLPL